MEAIRRINPVARAVLVIGAVMALVTSMTFAALQSQATLTGNTLSAADSNLQIWDGTQFTNTAEGFAVDDLVPGEWTEENFIYFKNASEGNLNLSMMSSEPLLPEGEESFGFDGWENLKVRITSYSPECTDDNHEPASILSHNKKDKKKDKHGDHSTSPNTVVTTMADLIAGDVELPCNSLSEGAQGNSGVVETEGNYSIAYKLAEGSVTGDDVNIGSYDLTFTGTVTGNGGEEEPSEPEVPEEPEAPASEESIEE